MVLVPGIMFVLCLQQSPLSTIGSLGLSCVLLAVTVFSVVSDLTLSLNVCGVTLDWLLV